jgi:hypothetical protein
MGSGFLGNDGDLRDVEILGPLPAIAFGTIRDQADRDAISSRL